MDVGDVVADRREPGGEGVSGVDPKAGQPVVHHAGDTAGKVVRIRHRRAVLAGVEEDEAGPMLDDVDVDGPR
ncbi:hypothetical protein GCM10023317_46820 [Actinopolymorpha pittospori]